MVESAKKNTLATGRRKVAVARAVLTLGKGNVTCNNKNLIDYFYREVLVNAIVQPMVVTDTKDKYDVKLNVHGGGLTGQAGAAQLAIARAILVLDPNAKTALKKSSFLTRDSRMKERKKYGQKGARAKFQFSKR